VVAEPAGHVERPHAVGAHVAQRHGLDRFVEAPGCHPAIVGRTAAVGEACRRRSPLNPRQPLGAVGECHSARIEQRPGRAAVALLIIADDTREASGRRPAQPCGPDGKSLDAHACEWTDEPRRAPRDRLPGRSWRRDPRPVAAL
jgi:hypothetical protein